MVYVTGGEELTITSSATSSTISNVHFEVAGYTSLVLDVPDLTMTGINQSVSENVVVLLCLFYAMCFPIPRERSKLYGTESSTYKAFVPR